MTFLDAIAEQVLVLDCAMGTMTQNLDLSDQDFGGPDFRMLGDLLSFSHPTAIEDIHLSYFESGANMVETNTFGASPFRLSEYNFAGLDLTKFGSLPSELDMHAASYDRISYWMNKRSSEIAVRARERHRSDPNFDGRPLFVAGSIGPSSRVISKPAADLPVAGFV